LAFATIMAIAFVISFWLAARHLSGARRARGQVTAATEYRILADEFRRLSDMAITAQEHVDLRLTEISVHVDALRGQVEQMQRILEEVE
jgi:hypothetical protein